MPCNASTTTDTAKTTIARVTRAIVKRRRQFGQQLAARRGHDRTPAGDRVRRGREVGRERGKLVAVPDGVDPGYPFVDLRHRQPSFTGGDMEYRFRLGALGIRATHGVRRGLGALAGRSRSVFSGFRHGAPRSAAEQGAGILIIL
jgi:hypothetical protein